MAEESYTPTTDDTNSEFRDSIVTYSTNAGDSSSDTTSQRDSYTTSGDSSQISQIDNFNNRDVPRSSNNNNNITSDNEDDDDEDIVKQKKTSLQFYKKKRFWVICAITSVILSAILLPIFLLVIFPAIARKTLQNSNITINNLLIKDPQESGFKMDLSSSVSHGGPYKVKVDFPGPVTIFYKGEPLGQMSLNGTEIKDGNGQLNADNDAFTISDPNTLISFTSDLLTAETVEWVLKGKVKVELEALHYSRTINLDKAITINGANKFQNTTISSLAITQNNVTNALDLAISAVLNNPSPFGIELGVLALEVYYNSTMVAPVTSDSFTLVPGENTINMKGTVAFPQTDNDRANMEGFVSSYIKGEASTSSAKGVSATPPSGTPVSWLNEIMKGLVLDANLAASVPYQVITGIDLGQFKMTFTNDTAYAPISSSVGTVADYKLPFNINLQVLETSQNVKIYTQDQLEIASLSTASGAATNDATKIFMNIPATPFAAEQTDTGKLIFEDFIKNLTVGSGQSFQMVGTSNVTANTVIGNLTLTGIPVNTTTTINGFQGLVVKPPVISNLTLIGGTEEGLVMSLNVDLFNPTNFSLDLGSVDFQMTYLDQPIGFARVANLSLTPADSILSVVSTIDPNNNPLANDILNFYLNGTQANVTISGYDNSTTITSLLPALKATKITSTLPPLSVKLLGKTSLQVLPETATNGHATASADLINPFPVDLSISAIKSTLGFHGQVLATMDANNLPTPIVAAGNKTTTIAGLPINLNTDPTLLFNVMRKSAKAAGLDLTPIDVVLTLGGITGVDGFEPIDVKSVDPSIFKNFDFIDYSEKALDAMTVDVNMESTVTVGSYTFDMAYVQFNVTAGTDKSIAFLVSALSTPIVQKLVDGSNIEFNKIFIQNPSETGFNAAISGEIDDSAPFDATISFPNGATVSFENTEFGKIAMPDISAVDGKAVLDLHSQFQITNTQALSAFTVQILSAKSASWTMAANNLTVKALNLAVPNINLSKTIELAGANGFLNDIEVVNFTIPGTTPEGGMAVSVKVNMKNEAVVGMELGTVNFNMFFEDQFMGPIAITNATILPSDTVPLTLDGQILPPTTPGASEALKKIFQLILANEPVPFKTVGDSVVTKNGPVSWLTDAIKKLSIELPVKGPKLTDESVLSIDTTTISHITANSFDIQMVGSISKTGPFAATLSYPDGVDVLYKGNALGNAKLAPINVTPDTVAKINNNGTFSIKDADALVVFTGDLLASQKIDWEIKTATMQALVGKVPITNMPFDKTITLLGFNGLKDGIKIDNVTYGKGGDGKGLPLIVESTFINPSNVGIELGTIVLDTSIEDVPLAPLTGEGVVFVPKGNSKVTFTGEITDFAVIEKILAIISSGKQPLMTAVGKSVAPPNAGGPVPWLEEAFSKFTVQIPFTLGAPPAGAIAGLSGSPKTPATSSDATPKTPATSSDATPKTPATSDAPSTTPASSTTPTAPASASSTGTALAKSTDIPPAKPTDTPPAKDNNLVARTKGLPPKENSKGLPPKENSKGLPPKGVPTRRR